MRIVWLPRAQRNLDDQVRYIAKQNPAAAMEQDAIVADAVTRLADFPQSGRPGRQMRTRELVIPGTSFIAVYRIIASRQEIHIIRLVHARQKYPPSPQSE